MYTVPITTICVLVVGFATVFSNSAAKAQSFETTVVAKIPFAFQVGDYPLPPGTYNMQTSGNLLWIEGNSESVAMFVEKDSARTPLSRSTVVFHRYGNQYFLREVRSAGDGTLLWAGETKAERRAKSEEDAFHPNSSPREDSKVEVALLAQSSALLAPPAR